MKDKHNEFLQEKRFLDEQIAIAKENKVNLQKRYDELVEELNELKEGGGFNQDNNDKEGI